MRYRVWFDPLYDKHFSEAEDGSEFDASTPTQAARKFAAERYGIMQHVDPGVVLVRQLDEDGTVVRCHVHVSIDFVAKLEGVVADDSSKADSNE